jgi:bleomycin hydrolase
VAVVPTFDIPSAYIDEHARQFRFSHRSTSDDHAVHLVGTLEVDGQRWYLIKDSEGRARNGRHQGYMLYHEDYVKLKMMNLLLHRSLVEPHLAKRPT